MVHSTELRTRIVEDILCECCPTGRQQKMAVKEDDVITIMAKRHGRTHLVRYQLDSNEEIVK
jgi:hypothetical protein